MKDQVEWMQRYWGLYKKVEQQRMFWQGKWAVVRLENNALRKKVKKLQDELNPYEEPDDPRSNGWVDDQGLP
jgi:hypothetical protein